MPDYGHDLMFGAMLEPERAADAVALAVLAEQVGLDAVSLADHPYWPERLDTFALLAFIAARTDRVRVFPNLANLPLRPPAMLARTAATLDVLSDGRFELGIGSGASSCGTPSLPRADPCVTPPNRSTRSTRPCR